MCRVEGGFLKQNINSQKPISLLILNLEKISPFKKSSSQCTTWTLNRAPCLWKFRHYVRWGHKMLIYHKLWQDKRLKIIRNRRHFFSAAPYLLLYFAFVMLKTDMHESKCIFSDRSKKWVIWICSTSQRLVFCTDSAVSAPNCNLESSWHFDWC